MKRIGILTSGGDAPGMNAVIRAVVRTAISCGMDVMGIERGFDGMIDDDMKLMERSSVGDIMQRGGTVLKTARSEKFMTEEGRETALRNLKLHGIEAVVACGGDGTFRGAAELAKLGVTVMGIPCTIDNDMGYTDYTIGFDTAVNTVLSAIGNIRDTANSHDRTTIIEVMGRDCGDIAMYAGVTGGAECILIPEVETDTDKVCQKIVEGMDKGKRHSIIVRAEGASVSTDELAEIIRMETKVEVRKVVLAYLQRGGSPSMEDRLRACLMGYEAVKLIEQEADSAAIGINHNEITSIDIMEAVDTKRKTDFKMIELADMLSK